MEGKMPRLSRFLVLPLLALAVSLVYFTSPAQEKTSKPDFDMTASYSEACSCDMFCPCYFNTHSTNHMSMGDNHMDEHFCRASLVLKVDKGTYKDVKLDGAKVWIASDLGSDWSTGKDSWLVVNFDPSVTKEQQAALADILGQLYPIPWQKKAVQTVAFSWNVDTKTGVAHAKMSDGKGEVILERVKGDNSSHEVVMHNLKYWGAQSNDGFRMWRTSTKSSRATATSFPTTGRTGS